MATLPWIHKQPQTQIMKTQKTYKEQPDSGRKANPVLGFSDNGGRTMWGWRLQDRDRDSPVACVKMEEKQRSYYNQTKGYCLKGYLLAFGK